MVPISERIPVKRLAELLNVTSVVFARAPWSSSIALAVLLVAAACELLGIASLLPVITAISNHGEIHHGVPSFILSSMGVSELSLPSYLVLVVIAVIIRGAALFLSYILIAGVSTRIESEFTTKILDSAMMSRWPYLLTAGTPRIVDAATRQAFESSMLATLLTPLWAGSVLASVFLAAAGCLSPRSLLIAAGLAVALMLCLQSFRRMSLSASRDLIELNQAKSRHLLETLQNAKYLKVSRLEQSRISSLRGILASIRARQMRLQFCYSVVATAPDALVVIGVSILIGIVLSYSLDTGTNFMLALLLLYRAFHYLNLVQGTLQQMSHYSPSFHGAIGLIAEADAAREIPSGAREEVRFQQGVSFENVSFGYEQGKPILSGLTFAFSRNELVVVRGRSGSGKTTFIDLLSGLQFPQSGRILVDGVPLTSNRIDSWREKIAYIPQEPPVFEGTIRSNLSRDVPQCTDKLMLESLRTACLDDVVHKAEDLDQQVGERGLALSGGQRQRLLIARALIRDAEIFLLDEPTSAVDPGSEEEIFSRILAKIHGKKTLVVVTHRSSAALKTERVLEL